jgi:tRNA/rRNA methyltransferase
MSLERCRVVLVRPRVAGNLGATARIMRNMGLSDLVLVAPETDPAKRQARRMSTHGEPILRNARVVGDLAEALADCAVVAATSARKGRLTRGQAEAPETVMPRLIGAAQHSPVALVFGPERTGLSNEEVMRCHHLIHIDASDDYPALNLAQAVAVCLYELRRAWRHESQPPTTEPAPSFADQERMFDHLRTALEEIHFLYGPKSDSLMHALRRLIGRAQPGDMEIGILQGLARQIRWYVREHPKKP